MAEPGSLDPELAPDAGPEPGGEEREHPSPA
jgi:hypothetical protein